MAKGGIIRALMGLKHSPAGKKYLADKKKKKKDTVPTYFRGKAFERESIESQLRQQGIDPDRFKSRKKKK